MHNSTSKSNLENAFFPDAAVRASISNIFDESGMDALMKLARTNQLCSGNFRDYANSLIPDRLELLPGTARRDPRSSRLLLDQITYIVNCAREAYEFVILDINAGYGELSTKTLDLADVLIISLSQNMEVLRTYFERREWNPVIEDKPHLLVLGNYDENSIFTVPRIRKEFAYSGELFVVPRNVRFMDSVNQHEVLQYFAGLQTKKKIPGEEADFMKCLDHIIEKIICLFRLDNVNTYNPLMQKTMFDKMLGVFR
jgi:cellulose biosynthesis protein BcsQ